nr:hypothetical protein [Tanacetum cinerariifolium]
MNLKLLRCLPSEWKTHALIWWNKAELETISLDDLYNNLKIYEPKILGLSDTNQNPQNMAFVSPKSTSITNEADTTASGISAAHTQVLNRSAKFNTATASVNTVIRPVNAVGSQSTMNHSIPISKGNPQQKEYKEKGVIDSGCYRHMTGNKCYLIDFEAFDGGFVSFGDGKGKNSEERVDYDESFAPMARMEAIRIFLVFATYMNFKVNQMDVKSAFMNGIENQLACKVKVIRSDNGTEFKNSAMTQFCDDKGIKREYSVARTSQQNEVAERRNRTLIEAARTMDNLGKFEGKADEVYVGDIIFRSTNKELCKALEELMKDKFQMSSMGELTFFFGLQVKQKDDGIFISQDNYVAKILRKPDIMFTVCACARFQVTPKVSHLHKVKRIFSDYAGSSLDRKSTTGGCQFLGSMDSKSVTRLWGPKASRALFEKRQKPKYKKPPTKTKVTTPNLTKGSEQSYLVSSGTIHDPQDLERNIQLASTGFPSTLDGGTRKS